MKTAYFDCSAGISGDMCLGALVSAGLPLSVLQEELDKLSIKGLRLSEKKVLRSGVLAMKIDVHGPKKGPATWAQTLTLIGNSRLSSGIKTASLAVLKSIFNAEAKVHGTTINRVHLHEMGSIDCIADVVGAIAGIRALGIKKVCSSPVNLGSGTVKTAHGALPVPAPATVEILIGAPVYSDGTPHELTTPTGAALIKSMASSFGDMPAMKLKAAGAGAGSRDIKEKPNILRVFTGEAAAAGQGVMVLETNIDDTEPRVFGYLTDKLLKEGALDTYLTPVIMKKGRPGVKLTVLCHESKKTELMSTIFAETTTLGIRYYRAERAALERSSRSVDTRLGKMRVKEAVLPDGTVRVAPEYDDCARIARRLGLPLMEVIKRVRDSAM